MFYENRACYAATCSINYRDAVAAPSPTSHCGGDVFNVKTSDLLSIGRPTANANRIG